MSEANKQTAVVIPDHMARFESTTFKLTGEVEGAVFRKKSDKGAVRMGVVPLKTIKANTLLDGDDAVAYRRKMTDALKIEQGALVARLLADPKYTGKEVSLNAKGNVITLKFEKAPSLMVDQLKPDDIAALAETLPIEKLEALLADAKKANAEAEKAAANSAKSANPTEATAANAPAKK